MRYYKNSKAQHILLGFASHLQGIGVVVALCFFLLACLRKDDVVKDIDKLGKGNEVIQLSLPLGFPYPIIPNDNLPTQNRIRLGRMLFFDPILSRDSTVSCESCHHENNVFSDTLRVSIGIEGRKGTRNTPSLVNIAYQPVFFWDGGVPSLEQQVLAPFDAHAEFDFDINKVALLLNNHPAYPALFQKAYNRLPDVYSITRAIACFERTLYGGTSKYDSYVYKGDSSALTISEIRGMKIFFGENGECFHCHQGFNFTDYSFRNNGLYSVYPDSGRAMITLSASDLGKFKVPSLRNIEKTAPYMHDGSFPTLEKVVQHYVEGGRRHRNKDRLIQPLALSKVEQQDLINFLKSLSDQ